MTTGIRHVLPAVLLLSLTAPAALARDNPGADDGAIKGELRFELQNDWTTHSGDAANKRNDTFLTIETAIEARLAPSLILKGQLTFEPVRDPEPGKDRVLGDQGAYLEQIFVEYARGGFALRGGKFGQKFGTAWDVAPGIWGTDFAEDYELAEQIGLAGDYNFGSESAGRHVVTVGTFFTDTTVLSESVLTNRHRTRHAAGGAGNTEDFSSFSVALEGGESPALPGLGYHLAYARRDSDGAGETAESGIASAVRFKFKLGAVEVDPLIEYARFDDRAGVAGTDANYLTTAAQLICGQWNLALSRTARKTRAAGSADVDDSLAQATVGYAFETGINANVGYRNAEDSGVTTETYGVLVDYALKF